MNIKPDLAASRYFDSDISKLFWLRFTSVNISRQALIYNVRSWFIIIMTWSLFRLQFQRYSLNIDSTLKYGWWDWQRNLNIVSRSAKQRLLIQFAFSISFQPRFNVLKVNKNGWLKDKLWPWSLKLPAGRKEMSLYN